MLKNLQSHACHPRVPDRTYLSNQMKELRIRRDCGFATDGDEAEGVCDALCRLRVLPRRVPRGAVGGRLPCLQARCVLLLGRRSWRR
jgi:hypothetical protein